MKKILLVVLIIVVILVFIVVGRYLFSLLTESSSLPQAVVSDFNTNSEGWRIVQDVQSESSEPTYYETGGVDAGAYISATDDVSHAVWYFQAPEKFLGKKSSHVGGTLEYWLKQSNTSRQFTDEDIVIEGKKHKIVYRFDYGPGTEWTQFTVVLNDAAGWHVGTYDGEQATTDVITEVLSDIVSLKIRGEYRTGSDIGGLDAVRLQ